MKAKQVKSTKKHKALSMAVSLVSVILFFTVTFYSILYTKPAHNEPSPPNLCQSLDSDIDIVMSRGLITKTYERREGSCTGFKTTYYPFGILANMLPGLVLGALVAFGATHYLRRSMR